MAFCSGSHHKDNGSGDNAGTILNLAIIANVFLTFVQIVGGLLSGSLSLVADAVHNLSDAAALIVARIAIKIGQRPADSHKTFGYKRAETIAALINFVVLVTIGVFLCFEAFAKFLNPEPINGIIVMAIAGVALIVDLVTAFFVYKSSQNSMNMKAVLLHNIADALSSIAVLAGGLVIHLYGWIAIDALLTVLIAGYIIGHGLHGLPQAIHLLMDGTPKNIEISDVAKTIESIEHVTRAHHIHIRQIDEWRIAMEGHVILTNVKHIESAKSDIKDIIAQRFNITHSTLEFSDNMGKLKLVEDAHDDDCHTVPYI